MTTKNWKKSDGAMAFSRLFESGNKRNAQMAVNDPTTPPKLRAELKRYLDNPLRAASDDIESLLRQRNKYRTGGVQGRKNTATQAALEHIRSLLVQFPDLSRTKLFEKSDKKIIGSMVIKTFGVHMNTLRKDLRLRKK